MNTSKDYNNCPLKRSIQATLFPKKADIILGLSSPKVVPSYLAVLPKYKELYLVNYEPEEDSINANSLVGMLDILLHNKIIPDFIDADFCDSILNSGSDLMYIYNKYQELQRSVTISYTFAVRGVTLENTMKWLENFPVELGIKTPYEYSYAHRQFAYQYGESIHYRDSGEQMITGIIKIDHDSKNRRESLFGNL
jgi:hypothetical protein